MKLDKPKANSIVIKTMQEISINGQNIGKCQGYEIKIDETQKVNEKDVFLTRQLANSFVSAGFAIFDYEVKDETPEIQTPNETSTEVKKTTKNKQDESGNKVDGQK